MKYTQIPENAFKNIQLNAGILVDSFTPASGVIGNIIGATSGGVNFKATPNYQDFGSDVDNCPPNLKELKKLISYDVSMSGTMLSVTAATIKTLIGAADIDESDATHIVPRENLVDGDFKDIWWVGDYSDKNSDSGAGFCAIHMMNTLNVDGFQIKSAKDGKGQFAFNFAAHYSAEDATEIPFEVYIKAGT